MADYYKDENVIETSQHMSPSGNYKLIVKKYNTSKVSGQSTWEYTQGLAYDMDNNLIGYIKRNYSEFPFVFFKQDEKEYLVSGRSYMKQTILDLQSGEIYDNSDNPDVDEFCWADISQLDENTLVVNGCYWGGGYEYKFFDFSDITKGWPELQVDDEISKKGFDQCYAVSNHRINKNERMITLYHLNDYKWNDESDDESDDKKEEENLENSDIIITLQRQDNTIKMVNLILSEQQKVREKEKDIRREEENKKREELKNNSIFYQQLMPQLIALDFLVRDNIFVHNNTFTIYINYKKIKFVALRFKNGSKVEFMFYDVRDRNKYFNLEYEQDSTIINDIVTKIKEVLVE